MKTFFNERALLKQIILAALLLPLTLVSSAAGLAERDRITQMMYQYADRTVERIADDLVLTSVQRQELDELKYFVETNLPERQKDKSKKAKDKPDISNFVTLLRAESFDSKAFEAQWQDVTEQRLANQLERKVFMDGVQVELVDFLVSLNPEQRSELADFVSKFDKSSQRSRWGRFDDEAKNDDKF